MSARALPGNREESNRAGMTAVAETKRELRGGPKLETGGTANITTTARLVMRLRASPAHDARASVFIHCENRSSMVARSRRDRSQSQANYLMKPTRAAAYVLGGMLLAAWLASAAGV